MCTTLRFAPVLLTTSCRTCPCAFCDLCFFQSPSKVVEEAQAPLSEYYRLLSKGAWPFSSRDHGWPISDCSSEGLKAALTLARLPEDKARYLIDAGMDKSDG